MKDADDWNIILETVDALFCSLADGIARRAGTLGFKGDAAALYDSVKGADCPASATIPPRVIRDLAAAADAARGQ